MLLRTIRDGGRNAGKVLQLVQQRLPIVIVWPARDLQVEQAEEGARDLGPVADVLPIYTGRKHIAQQIGLTGASCNREEPLRTLVGPLQVPDAIDGDRGKGLVALQDMVDRGAHGIPYIRTPAGIDGLRREPGRHQHDVLLRGRHFKRLAELPYRVSAGLRASSFEKAEMALRHAGIKREVELAQPSPCAPRFQQWAERILGSVDQECHAPFSRKAEVLAIT